jgi:peptidoglycan-associated lipoprotein
MRAPVLGIALALLAVPAAAQLRVPPLIRGQQPPPLVVTIEMLRADFAARTGSDTVFFSSDAATLDANNRAVLAAQARWLLAHPEIVARIEGHADERETRARALAVGERRANAVRAFLLLQGVPASQLTVVSWGKERPRADAVAGPMAIAMNRRAVTMLMPR